VSRLWESHGDTGSAFTQQYSFVRLIVVYRYTALSVPRAWLMLWFVGYLRTVGFIFNIRCGDDCITWSVKWGGNFERKGVEFFRSRVPPPPARQYTSAHSATIVSEVLAGGSWRGWDQTPTLITWPRARWVYFCILLCENLFLRKRIWGRRGYQEHKHQIKCRSFGFFR